MLRSAFWQVELERIKKWVRPYGNSDNADTFFLRALRFMKPPARCFDWHHLGHRNYFG